MSRGRSILNTIKNSGFTWPYNIPFEEAMRKALVLTTGVFIGAKLVNMYYKPMEVSLVYFIIFLLFSRYTKNMRREKSSCFANTRRDAKPSKQEKYQKIYLVLSCYGLINLIKSEIFHSLKKFQLYCKCTINSFKK
jgi:hypothetical protein